MAKSEFKLIIRIDPEKTEKYGYDYREVIEAVEKTCENYQCINQGDGVFTGRGVPSDVSHVGNAAHHLCHADWFEKCVKSIEWFAPRGEHIDLIQYYTEKKGIMFG
ncbi:hypothetical protein [Suipraeoptans intestinalis]|uniref:Uncharacterized protein n=1 Tax=Suipraeoptans intestinalis TaxID=2606628 RepID=A0A6N7V1M3_9FIRM|nr:hypothetical protein [Suipraeoptans intestinalis]MDD7770875.1 hypothetical protein [Suipraeoptans intestinalis]MDY3122458.1 hypothetical protein [Suipraeoptans intestinalis]MSR93756.1 hypothetical protein [Suipraeoptans intestinalis]